MKKRFKPVRFLPFAATVFFAAILTLASACQTTVPQQESPVSQLPQRVDDGKLKGFAIPAWRKGEFRTPEYAKAVQDIRGTGATWVSIHSTFQQDGMRGTQIFDEDGKSGSAPDIEEQRKAVQVAHKAGLKVMLKPHVNIRSGEGWRGDIGKGMTEREVDEWFANYGSLICAHAIMAQQEGVELFAVGTELMSMETHEAQWRELVAKIRRYYKGPIVYCANHSTEWNITWWDALDYIGIDAYYPLSDNDHPTIDSLCSAWQKYNESCAALAEKFNKKILFTEIGYMSRDGTSERPFDWNISNHYDEQEQADCYEAFFKSVYGKPWFDGVFFWNWDIYETPKGQQNDGYTPHLKPAESIVRSWFTGDSESNN